RSIRSPDTRQELEDPLVVGFGNMAAGSCAVSSGLGLENSREKFCWPSACGLLNPVLPVRLEATTGWRTVFSTLRICALRALPAHIAQHKSTGHTHGNRLQ